jgi:hypothetical protein
MLRAHILVAEHTWAQEEGSHGDSDCCLSRGSLHSDIGACVEVEALEATRALDSAAGVYV